MIEGKRWVKLLPALAVAALAGLLLSSCGAGDRSVKRDDTYYATTGVPTPVFSHSYYPYVESVELTGEFSPGEVMTARITISFPGEIPENLYYKDTVSNPITDWPEGSALLDVRLREMSEEAAIFYPDFRLYDGSRQLVHHFIAPAPGYYILWYHTARTPEEAGEYPDRACNPAIPAKHRPLVIREIE